MAVTQTSSADSVAQADLEALKRDIRELREDFAALGRDAGRAFRHEANRQAKRAAHLAEDAGEKAEEAASAVQGVVREHPFAALGIALAAGFLVAALSTRR